MADLKISALTASTTPLAGTEVLPIVQSSTTKQVSVANLTAGRAVSAASLALTTSPLPATSGGTGSSSAFTSSGVVYASSTTVLSTGSTFVFDGTNVGIGTSNPSGFSSSLAIRNDSGTCLSVNSTGSAKLNFQNIGVDSFAIAMPTTTGALAFYASGSTERMRIASTGIVTMSAYGAGAATFSAAGVISSVSDETWKIKDGVPVDPDAMLKKLEPGYWYYNDEKKEIFGVDRQLGFYAQNVNAAIGPEAAPTPEKGKPWGYYDRSVLAVTVMSLQKALATIESLTARIEALEIRQT